MISRRVLISLLLIATLFVAVGCAGRSDTSYQEITVPESPEDVTVEDTDEADAEGTETETMAEAQETEAEAKETEAEAQETEAEAKETEAEAQETMAEAQETEAEAKETEAEAQETMAEARETEAEAQETEAAQAPTAPTPAERPRPEAIEADEALAIVYPTRGHRMGGWVYFREVEGGVRVLAKFKGLKPNQKHGFHLHEYGDFGDRKGGLTAGGHYDPKNTGRHGRPNSEEPHHAGDLGNLEANADGVAGYDRVIKGISVAGGPNPILGRAVVVHTGPDDFSQPSGSAGPRLGVGVIGIANPD